MKRGRPKRYAHEYRRAGVANIFMFTEPLAGWRKISIRDQKTKRDWAEEIHHLLTVDYPDADKVILICDNLNTHKIGSLYDTYPPDIARDLAERLEIHFTPTHGSWLNIAECELSVFTRQCLGKRAGSKNRSVADQTHGHMTETSAKLELTGNSQPTMPHSNSNAFTRRLRWNQGLVSR